MFIDIHGKQVHFHCSGEGKDVLLLHGWGANIQAFGPVHRNLEQHFKVWSIDLPGFGESEEPPKPWGSDDFAKMLREFILKQNIEDPILIGHSNGGRVSIRYASEHPVNKVILVDSAGVKPKRKLNYYMKVYSFKTAKKILSLPGLRSRKEEILSNMKKKVGSTDYQNASGVMQQTLVRVVNEDLQHLMPKVTVPTLLVWGRRMMTLLFPTVKRWRS
ncbi:alpha/beta fold hydrolase [Geomicrobium sp. JCM 19039]|uniref:alpha/beta fold hydrolase n=1 Tax=Geomicrobium sp. JCM 19039 TaxID=1460636 RepID=UPI00045F23D0|nr:alpha/beta hydrolase [Geomicrobium sp. JCM 19039]GAK14270.1 hydrolase [Geomicrobium sp. JCM 19039]